MGMHIVEHKEGQELNSSSYASSEELNFSSGSDSEGNSGRPNYPEYFADSVKRNPQLEVGLLFANFDELKYVVRDYAVFNQVEPIFKCNEKNRLHCVCKDDCTWKLRASKIQGRETVQIKTYDPRHTCFKARTNKYVTYKWLADYYLDNFRSDPDWKIKNITATIKKDLRVHITKRVASNARKYAKVLVEGSDEEQFAMLGCYAVELRRTNPGSTVIISQVVNVFRGIYVCIEACKKGFMQGCRHFVGVDGCFLKEKYGGQLLAAVGVDANDCIYPIAYAIVERERDNTSSWRWFLMLLFEDLAMENWPSVTFTSDRQKRLINVVAELFSEAEHRFCVRHIYQNFFRSDFKGKELKDYLWGTAKSSHLTSFKYWMAKIVVDKGNRTCACRRWQISGIPCPHAIDCILDIGHEIKDYVSDWYKVETYMSTYENVIYPINGKALWPECAHPLVLPPPWYVALTGKKKKGPGEDGQSQSQTHSQSQSRIRKKGIVYMTCSACGEKRHNKRHHKSMEPQVHGS